MERHGVDEYGAFLMLRDEARPTRRKLVDLAEAVLTGCSRSAERSRPAAKPAHPDGAFAAPSPGA